VIVGEAGDHAWPELTISSWEDTRATLHLFTQVVGKVRLALEPMVNHWWQTTLYVSARGLTTSMMPNGTRGVEIEFDFVDHLLRVRTTDGLVRDIALAGQSVASFYTDTMNALADVGIAVEISTQPQEIPDAIRFELDHVHHAYDADAVHRYWRALVDADRVMQRFRSRFIGKASPVHYFWGGADLAASRFSGRRAPKHPGGVPNCADWVQELAYSHEVSSCGFWLGGSDEGSFYSYAYPTPLGFADWPVQPSAAYFDPVFGEFILPYRAVRAAPDPDGLLLEFFESTYVAAAELGAWDRAALEA